MVEKSPSREDSRENRVAGRAEREEKVSEALPNSASSSGPREKGCYCLPSRGGRSPLAGRNSLKRKRKARKTVLIRKTQCDKKDYHAKFGMKRRKEPQMSRTGCRRVALGERGRSLHNGEDRRREISSCPQMEIRTKRKTA